MTSLYIGAIAVVFALIEIDKVTMFRYKIIPWTVPLIVVATAATFGYNTWLA